MIEIPRPLKTDKKTGKRIRALNRGAIGKVLAGKDMLERKYKRQKVRVKNLVILCVEIDPAFKIVCTKEEICAVKIP